MKKYSIIILSLLSLALSSCFEEIDNWDSAVLDYSGRYVVKLLDTDGNALTDFDGTEIHLYSTSANKADEMWIDDFQSLFPMKSKIFFTDPGTEAWKIGVPIIRASASIILVVTSKVSP